MCGTVSAYIMRGRHVKGAQYCPNVEYLVILSTMFEMYINTAHTENDESPILSRYDPNWDPFY